MEFVTHIEKILPYTYQYYEEIEFYSNPVSSSPSPYKLELYNFITASKYKKQKLLLVTDGGAITVQGSIVFVWGGEKGNCVL